MKKYIKAFSLILFVTAVFSCGSDKEKSSSNGVDVDLDDAIAKAEGRRAADPNAKGGNTCLLGYLEKYDQLLTEDMVLSATSFDKAKLDLRYNKALKNPEYHSVSYRFKNKRKAFIEQIGVTTEVPDAVVLNAIKPMSLNHFRDTYRAVTQQETDVANQKIDEVVEGKSTEKDANDKIEELGKMGVDKKTTKSVTDVMKGTFANVAKSYVAVDGLADAATWNTFANTLNVITNGVHFELNVEISADNADNKKVAIAIANKILAVCK